jgi:hypothetical protein
MFVNPFRFCFIGAGRIGVRKLFEHTKDWFMRRSSLVTAALVVFMSSFSFSASASSNQPAVNSKSTGVKPPVDKHVWEVTGLF